MAGKRKLTPKKRRSNTGDWKAAFIKALSNTANVRESCKAAGVARQTAYDAKSNDPAFSDAWQSAMDDALDDLEKAARSRALNISDTLLIFLLKSHRRAVYGDRVALEHKTDTLGDEVRKRLDEVDGGGHRQPGETGGTGHPELEDAAPSPGDQPATGERGAGHD